MIRTRFTRGFTEFTCFEGINCRAVFVRCVYSSLVTGRETHIPTGPINRDFQFPLFQSDDCVTESRCCHAFSPRNKRHNVHKHYVRNHWAPLSEGTGYPEKWSDDDGRSKFTRRGTRRVRDKMKRNKTSASARAHSQISFHIAGKKCSSKFDVHKR